MIGPSDAIVNSSVSGRIYVLGTHGAVSPTNSPCPGEDLASTRSLIKSGFVYFVLFDEIPVDFDTNARTVRCVDVAF